MNYRPLSSSIVTAPVAAPAAEPNGVTQSEYRGHGPSAARVRLPRLSLAGEFLLAGSVLLVVGTLVTGIWLGQQLEEAVLNRTASIAALYVQSFIEPQVASLASRSDLNAESIAGLDRLLTDTPLGERVVAFRVWSPQGEVLYSPNRELIGRRFPVEGGLAQATAGEVSAEISTLDEEEHAFERGHWARLVEIYTPVRERGVARIVAVAEFYQPPDDLEREVEATRMRSWGVLISGALLAFTLLAAIVKRGSDTIERQQTALQHRVAELSDLLDQNAVLHDRVRQAGRRTTALNEQALRRIGADLHDGPLQALALALLRLDAPRENEGRAADRSCDYATVHDAVHDALAEIRAIAAGLRLPELAARSVPEVAARAVRDHERRSAIGVRLSVATDVPAAAPLPVKIALFRSLQEGLSNATRHGGGVDVSARLWAEGGALFLEVSDRGPGFAPESAATEGAGHLGLAAIRERAELLGGNCRVESAPGRGATVRVCWPLAWEDG
jgi:signal transduction histidine kinase